MLKVYSYSSLNCYQKCPQQFKFRYVDRVDIPKKVSAEQYLGNTIHRTLRKLYTLGADNVVCPLDDILEFYNQEWEKVDKKTLSIISEYHTIDDYIRNGAEMLGRFYEKYKPFKSGILLGAEKLITFTLKDTPFKFRTIIDRLTKHEDGTIEICDYKTGQRMLRPLDIEFRYQMGLYQLSVLSQFPRFEEIELKQYYLKQDEEVSYRMSSEEIDELSEKLRQDVLETIDAEKMDSFLPKESKLCDYCDYYTLCPAKRHQKLLEMLEKSENEEITLEEKAFNKAERFVQITQKEKEAKAEKEKLRGELIELAKELGVSKLTGRTGDVDVRIRNEEKFITKSKNPSAFAEFSYLVRQMGMGDYFELNGREFMKSVYKNRRLPEDQMEKLKAYITIEENARVAARMHHQQEEDDND